LQRALSATSRRTVKSPKPVAQWRYRPSADIHPSSGRTGPPASDEPRCFVDELAALSRPRAQGRAHSPSSRAGVGCNDQSEGPRAAL